MLFNGWYPVNIRESRYGGAYSGGMFIITCGAANPEKLNAFGADTDCMIFWNEHEENGPVMEVDTPFGTEEVYVNSANSPVLAYKKFIEYLKEEEDYNISE